MAKFDFCFTKTAAKYPFTAITGIPYTSLLQGHDGKCKLWCFSMITVIRSYEKKGGKDQESGTVSKKNLTGGLKQVSRRQPQP